MREYMLKVTKEQEGKRLDLFLSSFSKEKNLGLSRTLIQDLILKGRITVKDAPGVSLAQGNSGWVKPHYKIKASDKIKIIIDTRVKSGIEPERIPLDIIYEDRDLAVINKPVGLVVHPAPGNYKHTLVNALLAHFPALAEIGTTRPGIVHRLDKDTSGLILVAKTAAAQAAAIAAAVAEVQAQAGACAAAAAEAQASATACAEATASAASSAEATASAAGTGEAYSQAFAAAVATSSSGAFAHAQAAAAAAARAQAALGAASAAYANAYAAAATGSSGSRARPSAPGT